MTVYGCGLDVSVSMEVTRFLEFEDESFKDEDCFATGGAFAVWARSGDKREGIIPFVQSAVSNAFGISVLDLLQTKRGPAGQALARQVAMYLSHVHLGLTLTRTGEVFGRDRTTVAYACELVENLRDDVDFDQIVGRLECALLAVEISLLQPEVIQKSQLDLAVGAEGV